MNESAMENDKIFLKKAIDLASTGILNGSGPFAALIVKDDKILSESSNRVVLDNDPTAHAEILVIRDACRVLGTFDLEGCIIYSSCEPCPMCLGAIYWSGIEKVVYACDRKDAEEAGFSDNHIYDELILDPGKRKISFIRIEDCEGENVFKRWNEFENRVKY